MEGCFIEDANKQARVQADRHLRAYRRMDSVLRSSRAYGRHFDCLDHNDETAIQAQMYFLRSCILSLSDAQERLLLYHYYVKGQTIEVCAKLLGVSMRTAFRLKGRALEKIAPLLIKDAQEKQI